MQLFGTSTEGLGAGARPVPGAPQVLAENIANAETPGYRARDLDFADALANALAAPQTGSERRAIRRASRRAMPSSRPSTATATVKPDGNSVALDIQVGGSRRTRSRSRR